MPFNYSTKNMSENSAKAVGTDLPISTKHAVEICRFIRKMNLEKAKKLLNDVAERKQAVPFKRFHQEIPHRKGMGPGRYPKKASLGIVRILESAEANAQLKGLNTKRLVISHLRAHKASKPWHFGRWRGIKMKRTHVEVVLEEKAASKKEKEKAAKETPQPKEKKAPKDSVKEEKPKVQAEKKPEQPAEKKEAPKQEAKQKVKQEKPQEKKEAPKEIVEKKQESPVKKESVKPAENAPEKPEAEEKGEVKND